VGGMHQEHGKGAFEQIIDGGPVLYIPVSRPALLR
jgi:hypothetical protein